MNNLTEHAKRELELAGMFDEDSGYDRMVGESVIELIEVFAKQWHHSGLNCDATMDVIHLFNRVSNEQVLTPVDDGDGEWVEGSSEMYMHKRLSSLWREGKKGSPYFLNAIIFKNQHGELVASAMTEKGESIGRFHYVKYFPFQPKTFIIDVISHSIEVALNKGFDLTGFEFLSKDGKSFWKKIHTIADPEQLNEVWEYYDRKDK